MFSINCIFLCAHTQILKRKAEGTDNQSEQHREFELKYDDEDSTRGDSKYASLVPRTVLFVRAAWMTSERLD